MYYFIGFLAVTGLMISSCTKEVAESNNQSTKPNLKEAEYAYQQILQFKSQVTDYKTGRHCKSGERMSIGDMVWNYNALVNFDHSFVDEGYTNFLYDSTFVSVAVDQSDSVSMENVLAAYLSLEEKLEQLLSNSPFSDKAIKFSFIQISDNDQGFVELKAETTIGDLGNKPKPPFTTGEDWIYGNNLGKCDGTPYYEDAADKIGQAVNTYRYLHINDQGKIVFYVNPVNIIISAEDIINPGNSSIFDLTNGTGYDNDRDYRLFYANELNGPLSEVYCVEHPDMNFYYEQLEQLVYNIIPYKPQTWPQAHGKVFVNIYAFDGGNSFSGGNEFYFHEPKITFAKRFVIEN